MEMIQNTPVDKDMHIYIQIQIHNCLLVNQRAQVLPMYKNNTQQYKHIYMYMYIYIYYVLSTGGITMRFLCFETRIYFFSDFQKPYGP